MRRILVREVRKVKGGVLERTRGMPCLYQSDKFTGEHTGHVVPRPGVPHPHRRRWNCPEKIPLNEWLPRLDQSSPFLSEGVWTLIAVCEKENVTNPVENNSSNFSKISKLLPFSFFIGLLLDKINTRNCHRSHSI